MPAKIHELRQKRATLARTANEALEAAQKTAATEGRALSAEELKAQDDFDAQLKALDAEVALEERKLDRERLYGSAAPADPAQPRVPGSGPQRRIQLLGDRAERDPRRGFASHRDFLLACMANAGFRAVADVADERLRPLAVVAAQDDPNARGEVVFLLPEAFTPGSLRAAVGSDEQGEYSDRYGGFAVPSTLSTNLLQLGMEADPSAGRTQPVPMATPLVEIPARTDKDHTTSVSGGLIVTRRAEAVEKDPTRFEMEKVSLRASSLFGLAFATEEILADSPISFAALIAAGFQSEFASHMLDEKIRGKGGNEYLGILNSPALVTIAKEGGQVADTIVAENVIKMRSQCWGYGQAIWIANHDTLPQLVQLAIVAANAAGTAGGLILVYKPSSQEDVPDMLLGRPIFYSEYASTVGDVGDIMLVNWSQFLEGTYQPLQSAESVHVRFVAHERAFKFWLRNAGAPWWKSELTPKKGANKLSPLVTLAAR